jgi:hypothetical protein
MVPFHYIIKYTILEMSDHLFYTPVYRTAKFHTACRKPGGFIIIHRLENWG